jgi:hypothetical protein
VALVPILFGLVPHSLLKSFGTGLGEDVLQNRTQREQRRFWSNVERLDG